MLIGGFDPKTGTRLFQTDPSGNYYEFKAIAIGARSQSAKTYLEKNYESFDNCDLKMLILHALKSLHGTKGDNVELHKKNCSVGIVGEDMEFHLLEEDEIQPYLEELEEKEEDEDEEMGQAPAQPAQPAQQ